MSDKVKCKDLLECSDRDCPAYDTDSCYCWLIDGTHCSDGVQDTFLSKVELCLRCPVFKMNMDMETLEVSCNRLAEQFIEARRILNARDRELESVSMEMAIGLSEVFEALKKIAAGYPKVRLNEASPLELIAKLKQMVNRTAENTGEMVDMTHEFAMGLAEHFDVLHRVAGGDLSARVQGGSSIELLESLKTVTNQMIRSVGSEIDHRQAVTRDLGESEEKYRTLVENIQDGVILIEKNLLLFVNEAMARMTGYTTDELIGMTFSDLVAPEDRQQVLDRYYRRQAGKEVERSYEFRLLHKDGATRLFVNIHAGIVNYKNRVVTIATIKDITEKKRAEQEHRHMAERLERSKKMEAIGTLAGGVAHDLNNILSGIVSYPELLLMDLPDDSPLKGPISTIQKSGERAAAIVQDLLTLARRGVATMETIDLNMIVSDYLDSPEFAKLCSFHPEVAVEPLLADDLLTISGSPVHLLKTVMNLVSNAAEAMPAGGKIHIITENKYIDRSLKGYDEVKEGEYVSLIVTDKGVGISAEDIEKIFEPFYTKKVMGRSGTGLGMAVVWGSVKDHNGYIDVKSIEGQGTTLTLFFPVSRDRKADPSEKTTVDTVMGKGESILVVDDVPEQREIASAMLNRLGYSVVTAASGDDAVAYLKDHAVDLMVLDMIMPPGIDGLETYRQVAAFKPGQKAVIASGFSETVRVKGLQRLGAGEYLRKPYTLEKIGSAVKRTLGG
jgi:two-component system cell cycle sensor histidine kinase/response regulator CckA